MVVVVDEEKGSIEKSRRYEDTTINSNNMYFDTIDIIYSFLLHKH